MKANRFLLLSFLCLALNPLHSQTSDFPYQFGFRLSPNLGWVRPNSEGYSYDGLAPGFAWGFVGEYILSENYVVQSGINFVMNGGKLQYPYKSGTDVGTISRRYYLRSIEIPLHFKMQTREIGYLVYYGIVGLGTSIRYGAKAKDEIVITSPTPSTSSKEHDINSDIRFLRESLIIGLGIQYKISGQTKIFTGLTFNNGFTNILKGKNAESFVNQKAYSNYLDLNVGILF